jgi:hypothetical protein
MARADAPVSSRTSASRSLWTFRASPTTKADLDFLSASLHLSASCTCPRPTSCAS